MPPDRKREGPASVAALDRAAGAKFADTGYRIDAASATTLPETPLERLERRLIEQRRHLLQSMALDGCEGLPDMRALDTVASIEGTLAAIRRMQETAG